MQYRRSSHRHRRLASTQDIARNPINRKRKTFYADHRPADATVRNLIRYVTSDNPIVAEFN